MITVKKKWSGKNEEKARLGSEARKRPASANEEASSPPLKKLRQMPGDNDDTPSARTQPVVRMLAQFPKLRTRTSQSGLVEFAKVSVGKKSIGEDANGSIGEHTKGRDALLVIDKRQCGFIVWPPRNRAA
jgi:hypothetical protein